jgi:hypothetical protein
MASWKSCLRGCDSLRVIFIQPLSHTAPAGPGLRTEHPLTGTTAHRRPGRPVSSRGGPASRLSASRSPNEGALKPGSSAIWSSVRPGQARTCSAHQVCQRPGSPAAGRTPRSTLPVRGEDAGRVHDQASGATPFQVRQPYAGSLGRTYLVTAPRPAKAARRGGG